MSIYSITSVMKHIGIEMKEGLGLFLIDFGAYFPYSNQDDLILDVSLSTDERAGGQSVANLRNECVLNHRYSNTGYLTLTSKHGKKLCKHGCAMQLPWADLNTFKYLNIEYGFSKTNMIKISVPISINLSEETPYMELEAHLMLKDTKNPDLVITAYEKEDEYWRPFVYSTSAEYDTIGDGRFALFTPRDDIEKVRETGWIVFNETVNIYPCTFDELLV